MLTPWFGGSDSWDGFFQRQHRGGFFRHLQFCRRTDADPEMPIAASKPDSAGRAIHSRELSPIFASVIASNSQLQQKPRET
jgi:hypothetical protein